MPTPKRNRPVLPVTGQHYPPPSKPYVYRGTGKSLGVCSEPDCPVDLHPKTAACLDWTER